MGGRIVRINCHYFSSYCMYCCTVLGNYCSDSRSDNCTGRGVESLYRVDKAGPTLYIAAGNYYGAGR